MNIALDWHAASAATASHALEAIDVHLSYGSRRVLQGIHLRAQPGRLLALIGPNGAGKSSLLAVMAGLRRPSLGDMHLDGRAMHAWPPNELARRRAMLSQRVQLGFAFRVEEVVMLGRSPHGVMSTREADLRIVDAAMQATRVLHLRERSYLALSGGEQQRVQLARVLAQIWDCQHAPGWLLLDEPEAGLDIAHQHDMLLHAQTLARQGFGVVVVLHDLNLAARYADDIALLAQGRLIRHGEPTHTLDADVLSRIYGMPLQRSLDDEGRWLVHPARRSA
ncbi:heme ABC transporter ATP-binding protein [Dyella terrae]|uniref:heme ABC transporter ATP-binding protein n=1 Tax=Dyella terrae TaxID=522259 RepID=UPI001EFDDA67|nr:heme ABC transporter ATP-binding protein [Dyella terrae]ULU26575.1 heme ABC transporter ATP-binding protein [Dyella terrae]